MTGSDGTEPEREGSPESKAPPPAGPVPVRDVMRQGPGAPAGEEVEPAWESEDREFEANGEEWVARVAGRGAYGTGRRGKAVLVAVHFHRAAEPETPLREALIPAASFPVLRPEELASLLERATPIELDPPD